MLAAFHNDEYDVADEEEDERERIFMLQTSLFVVEGMGEKRMKIDHRWKPRKTRTKYRHSEALRCIKRDYLGIQGDSLTPLFNGREFDTMFQISRSRFQRMLQDFGNSGDLFYLDVKDCFGHETASLEARLLLPLKSIAFGVPPHTFRDYFQMSRTLARDCCTNFNRKIKDLYLEEYLRVPTKDDLVSILKLHRSVHNGVNGIFGSLDCMHTFWKNCPVAWQGSYKGAKKKPSIVLEAIADHHLWFWHASYGYAGTLNDLNILHLSPLFRKFVDGTFEELEEKVVPFSIGQEVFNKVFILVDGIYPRYSRFVKAFKEPITKKEKEFTGFQEAARKDIERAFGVLQGKFQILARPITLMDLTLIGELVACCLILHNMCVSDRVMDQDVYARYNPAFKVQLEGEETVDYPDKLPDECIRFTEDALEGIQSRISINNADSSVRQLLLQKARWKELQALEDYKRLQDAIMDYLWTNP